MPTVDEIISILPPERQAAIKERAEELIKAEKERREEALWAELHAHLNRLFGIEESTNG